MQLDLFSDNGPPTDRRVQKDADICPAELDDDALLLAIPESGLKHGPDLVLEAGRRGIVAAVPVIERYCRRLAGFEVVREQEAALQALAGIGGSEARAAVGRIINEAIVQGPTLKIAMDVAARLKCILPVRTVSPLLRHADPDIRADACNCTSDPTIISALVDLLQDDT